MINLIPPQAKLAVKKEYLVRVCTVWMLLLSFSCLIFAALQVPAYVLIENQRAALAIESTNAHAMHATFRSAEEAVIETNALARHLLFNVSRVPYSTIISELDELSGRGVVITQFIMVQDEQAISGVQLVGNAATRSDLASFNESVEAHERFMEVELPISSLTKDQDIDFTMSVSVVQQK